MHLWCTQLLVYAHRLAPCTPFYFSLCAAVQHAKGLGEAAYRSAGVVIIKYPLSQSHH